MVVAMLGSSCAQKQPHAPHGDEGPQRPDHAWFAQQRMSSGQPIPVRARQKALDRWKRRHGLSLTEGRAAGTWVFAGPSNIGGRLTAVAVDPHDAGHVWAGAAAGGVLESTDGGVSWSAVFDDQPLLPVGAIAAHPADSSIVYVGTGEANGGGYSYDGDGVYRTTDGGASWQPMGLDQTRRIGRIAIDPLNPQRIFVAAAGGVYVPDSHRGVYRSLDGGATWAKVLFVAPTAGAIDLAIDPANPDRVYAAIWEHYSTPFQWVAGGTHSGIWQSLDGGETWSRLAGGLPEPAPSIGRIGLAIAASSPQTVYALILDDPGSLIGVYKTTNAGVSWFRADPPAGSHRIIFGGFGYYFGQIRVDPLDPLKVYLLDVYHSRSTDGGATWTNVINGIHVDHHDLAILPGRLYMANDGGFYTSTDGGSTWAHSTSLPVSQFYDLGIDPADPDIRFGGLQDNGSVRTKTGGLSDWTSVHGGDGMHCEVDPTDGRRIYCEEAFGAIKRSTNGGNTFSAAVSGIAASDRRNWSAPITHDPLTARRLYTGTFRVYRSIDGAQTWSPVSGDLTDGPPPHLQPGGGSDRASHLASTVEGTISAIAVSRLDTSVVWAGTDDGNVWVSTDSGGVWTRVDVPGRTEWVTRIEADPFSAAGAFVTFSGYRDGSPMPRLHRTIDQGATWIDIGAGLPDVPLSCVTADSAAQSRGRLFVCTDIGVYVSDDYGGSWSELGSGLPRVVVHDLDLVDSSRELFAGTHARSMYRYDLDQLGPADADGDGADNVNDCAPADSGAFAPPGEVGGLDVEADRVTVTWTSAGPAAGPATVHQVLRGRLDGLPVSGGAGEACLSTGTTAVSLADPEVPPAGEGVWYIVRAVNSCGVGGYGAASTGQERSSSTCP